jgi:hypothetical protein
MEFFVKQWESLMQNARQANSQARYEYSLELNHSALTVSRQNFPLLFEKQPERAIQDVLVSYFSAIDNCIALSEFEEAQDLFGEALYFLGTSNGQLGQSEAQRSATFHGTTKLYYEWCQFIHHHRGHVSGAQRHAFQLSITRLASLRNQANNLH